MQGLSVRLRIYPNIVSIIEKVALILIYLVKFGPRLYLCELEIE